MGRPNIISENHSQQIEFSFTDHVSSSLEPLKKEKGASVPSLYERRIQQTRTCSCEHETQTAQTLVLQTRVATQATQTKDHNSSQEKLCCDTENRRITVVYVRETGIDIKTNDTKDVNQKKKKMTASQNVTLNLILKKF